MKACMTASGGVMFIPDKIARKKNKVSYKSLAQNDSEAAAAAQKKPRRPLFSFRRDKTKDARDSAAA